MIGNRNIKFGRGDGGVQLVLFVVHVFIFQEKKILKNLSLQMLSRGYLDFWSHSSERPLSVLIEISACSDLDFFVVVTV